MNTISLLTGFWHVNWLSLVISVSLIIFQLLTGRNTPANKKVVFYLGILLLLLSTVSPLAYLGKGYLFSAHMIEHIVLLLIIPPMLLVGINANLLEKLQKSGFRKVGEFLFTPAIAWILGIGAMYFWHIPAIFDAMKKSPLVHGIHIISLLVLGIIFIWPVYSPIPWKKLNPMQSVLYLFIACVGCTVLGIFITFAPSNIYTQFLNGQNPAVWNMVHNTWGIDPLTDQQAGGLIMWVPACIVYVTNILVKLAGYYSQRSIENEEVQF